MSDFLALLYLFIPAFVANSTPVLVCHVPVLKHWNTPVHEEWFGSHKTYRGFLFGVLFGVLVSLLQYALCDVESLASITLLHDTLQQSVLVGFLLGFGALAGDAAESFVKRRMHIAPGKALPFWDGADYMLGSMLLLSPVYLVSVSGIIFLLIAGPILSLCANCISYWLGLKEVWY